MCIRDRINGEYVPPPVFGFQLCSQWKTKITFIWNSRSHVRCSTNRQSVHCKYNKQLIAYDEYFIMVMERHFQVVEVFRWWNGNFRWRMFVLDGHCSLFWLNLITIRYRIAPSKTHRMSQFAWYSSHRSGYPWTPAPHWHGLPVSTRYVSATPNRARPGPAAEKEHTQYVQSQVGGSVANLAILSLDLEIFGGFLATKFVPSS